MAIPSTLPTPPPCDPHVSPLKTPTKWYPIVPNQEDPLRLSILFTPGSSQVTTGTVPALYAIRKAPTSPSHPSVILAEMSPSERMNIGFTYRNGRTRGQEHLQPSKRNLRVIDFPVIPSTIGSSSDENKSNSLYEDLEKLRQLSLLHPDASGRMEFGLIKTFPDGVPDGVYLEELEKKAISQSSHPLYNKQLGGGGITRKEHLRRKRTRLLSAPKLPFCNLPSEKGEGLYEPTRWYSCIQSDDGWICLKLPHSIASFSSEFIYVWRTKNDNKRLYGFSGQMSVANRVNSYFQNHTNKTLLALIRQNPQNFEFSLAEVVSGDQDPGEREKAYIRAYKSNIPRYGYNRNRGGGGARPMIRPDLASQPIEAAELKKTYKMIRILL